MDEFNLSILGRQDRQFLRCLIVQPEYLGHAGEVEVVKVRRDDELSESDKNAELCVFDRILANFCGPFYALRESVKGSMCLFKTGFRNLEGCALERKHLDNCLGCVGA